MDLAVDIKELISQAFHEIYDEPLEELELEDIFKPKTYSEFKLTNLDYNSSQIYTYIEHFLGCLKESFVNPVSYNTEFTYLVNQDLINCSNQYSPDGAENLIQNTPLTQINNMFQKFALLQNLFKINQEFSQTDGEIGIKRKLTRKNIVLIPFRMQGNL